MWEDTVFGNSYHTNYLYGYHDNMTACMATIPYKLCLFKFGYYASNHSEVMHEEITVPEEGTDYHQVHCKTISLNCTYITISYRLNTKVLVRT